jgi:hypothetical protein
MVQARPFYCFDSSLLFRMDAMTLTLKADMPAVNLNLLENPLRKLRKRLEESGGIQ